MPVRLTLASGAVPNASETATGKVELATAAETATGTSTTLAVHPAGLAARLNTLTAAEEVTEIFVNRTGMASQGTGSSASSNGTGFVITQVLTNGNDNGVFGSVVVPDTWATYNVVLEWAPHTATVSGNTRWNYGHHQHADSGGSINAAGTVIAAVTSASPGVQYQTALVTLASGVAVVPAQTLNWRVQRPSLSDALDTLEGDVSVISVRFVKAS